ncbi:hypothetical protein H7X46_12575 [Pseudonocardia sp. C8]|uniref:hypothetical protein n=1 Tax=Pseudonocardia sp. C8 TaxID=2762759 RepID=UPI001642E400|nr:hypothetical protein [Pseudonocardia sp. C8]MBC3191898.1 hypothetical protein [Pseudonocardia sp. C8]
MSDDGWYFCLHHHAVEPTEGCRAQDRLGPYPDEATAARAVELARERTEQEDRRDADWDG